MPNELDSTVANYITVLTAIFKYTTLYTHAHTLLCTCTHIHQNVFQEGKQDRWHATSENIENWVIF